MIGLLLVASMLLMTAPAKAHFMWLAADDPINEWLARQKNNLGGSCCAIADAHLYYGAFTINPDGGVTISLGNGAEAVVDFNHMVNIPVDEFGRPTDPNPTGTAVWWVGKSGTTYCFSSGSLT